MGQSILVRLGPQTLIYDGLSISVPKKRLLQDELTDRDTPNPIPY